MDRTAFFAALNTIFAGLIAYHRTLERAGIRYELHSEVENTPSRQRLEQQAEQYQCSPAAIWAAVWDMYLLTERGSDHYELYGPDDDAPSRD